MENLNSLGLINPTKIQSLSLPLTLEGKDVIAQAKTGSGKTVAFSIPIVKNLDVKKFKIQSLILAPTRELANQIAIEIRKLSRHIPNVKVLTLCGGVPYKPQVLSLNHGSHIVVATPGRVLKHIKDGNISFDDLKNLVLDEADKMLDMGFYDDIMEIIEALPQERQNLLFSATYEGNIQKLSKNILNNPTFVSFIEEEKTKIKQKFYLTSNLAKTSLIPALISLNKAKSTLIFCNTKIACEDLADDLYDMGLDVLTLNSDLEQKDRDETIVLFSNKSYPILIATDVASRGLHIDDVDLVINYDLVKNVKTHIHRIGRTARAGKGGMAVSLYTLEDDVEEYKESFEDLEFLETDNLEDDKSFEIDSDFRTILILGGKKQKIRAGDILGTLIATVGLQKDDVGKIDILDFVSYVAIKKDLAKLSFEKLSKNKIKGKYFRTYLK